MKIKPYEETHMDGIIHLENNPFIEGQYGIKGDFGIQVAEDGRAWVCIDGIAFLRFMPSDRYIARGSKLQGGIESADQNKK